MRNQRGSVIVWVTLMIVVLLFMVGMGLDTGEMVFTRSTGQAAVDAAALSAVTALPQARAANDPTPVYNRATALSQNDYTGSSSNAITSANVSFVRYDFLTNTVDYTASFATANGVRVALEGAKAMQSPGFLTPIFRLFGQSVNSANNVSVSAVSVINARPSIPIALWSSVCQGNTTVPGVEIAQQNPVNGENSCWTTYLDKSSGGSDIEDLFKASGACTGLPTGAIDLGIPIYENKGQVASVYDTANNFFLVDPATKNREWIIPVINGSGNCNAKDPSPIVAWAKIRVTAVSKHGSDSYIQADITCNQNIDTSENSLCFANRLVREKVKGM